MTIPLDNLYNYIFSLASQNHRVRLHYFYPHGSTDVENLIKINRNNDSYQLSRDLIKLSSGIMVFDPKIKDIVCYDQEPLNFDFIDYQYNTLNKISNVIETLIKSNLNFQQYYEEVKKHRAIFTDKFALTIYDKQLILHSEKNSNEVSKFEHHNFISVYYWAHALLALDWYRYAKFDKRLDYKNIKDYQNLFNIYCRSWTGTREYRLKFLELATLAKLDQVSNIKFNEVDNNIHFQKIQCQDQIWQPNTKNLNFKYSINNALSTASATYDAEDYANSAFDVVLETIFESQRIFLTEKILRPIACGKPFILLSSSGSLEYLRSYGFKTFSSVFDESYDLITEPRERMLAVISLMKEISTRDKDKQQKLIAKGHQIAEYNKKHFFSNKFLKQVVDELGQNLNLALNEIDINNNKGIVANKLIDYAILNLSKYNDPTKRPMIENKWAAPCHLTPAELKEYRKIINQT